MTVRESWSLLRVHALILLPMTMLGAVAGIAATELSDVNYTARADVFVTANSGRTTSDVADAAAYSQEEATSFAGLASRQVVLQPVIEELGIDTTASQLRSHLSVTVPLDTSIISISVIDGSPERAADIANAVAASLSDTIEQVTPTSTGGQRLVRVESIEAAAAPSAPTGPRPLLNVFIGLLVGIGAGVLLIALRDAGWVRSRMSSGRVETAPAVETRSERVPETSSRV